MKSQLLALDAKGKTHGNRSWTLHDSQIRYLLGYPEKRTTKRIQTIYRTLLMYYTNFLSSPEGYFQTVVCNAETFKRTVVNHDLHYIAWDVPPKQHPNALTAADLPKMVKSGAAFARKFDRGEPVLDLIDSELLGRSNSGGFVPGGWCVGEPPCSEVADPNVVRPGLGAERLGRLVDRIVWSRVFGLGQCK
ncbi:Beta-glucuronosyltransferase GlcAT14A [Ananas comosus]|uniref:Beta-glucuronosyltransferase GlcAT14A n=1 Tax=Ananas comosus TaxID=4615 RepID=A0A199VNT2_ANACO|nr:Beta-glucuronosyltransferase GlcAT14A [Ananas comosus]